MYQKIVDVLNNADTLDLLEAWNMYCEVMPTAHEVLHMEDFNDNCKRMSPMEIAEYASKGGFNINDHYYTVSCREFESSDYVKDLIYINSLARYIEEFREDFGIEEIKELFKEA